MSFQNLLVRKQKVMAWITHLALIQNKNALHRLFVKLIHKPFVHLAYVFPETIFQFVQLRFQTLGINFKIKQITGPSAFPWFFPCVNSCGISFSI